MEGQTISHYQILEKLGEGGMGVVYKALDTKLNRTVALKFLPPAALRSEEEKKRVTREAQAAASLNHPNIATVYEIDEADGPDGTRYLFIAMEYIEGKELEAKIASGPLKINDAITIAIQIAEGLRAAHEKEIVHRDMKSTNIMVTDKGQVKLMDFGLAKMKDVSLLTKEGTTLGTVPYMSPEQARGEDVDHRTDIWSLGVVLYEMVAGRRPFLGTYEQAIVYQILNEEPEPVTSLRSNVPMELERIIKKAMQKELGIRYQHLEDMITDLRALGKELETGETKKMQVKAGQEQERVPFIKDIVQRRVPQITALYAIVGYLVVQLILWVVDSYILSPHLVSLSVLMLLSLSPTVILLAYFHGSSGGRWTKAEKVGIPVNFALAVPLLFLSFQGKDLGSAMATVTVEDEHGDTIEHVIPKSEFRERMVVFFFENKTGDENLDWLQYGIPLVLRYNMSQDAFVNITTGYVYLYRMKEAGYETGVPLPMTLQQRIAREAHRDYFVWGEINDDDGVHTISFNLNATGTGRRLATHRYAVDDLFNAIDIKRAHQTRYWHPAGTPRSGHRSPGRRNFYRIDGGIPFIHRRIERYRDIERLYVRC